MTTGKFPTALLAAADVGGEFFNFGEATLSGNHTETVATITLTATAPASAPAVGNVTIDTEVIHYTGKSGATLTGCTRGHDGTTAASHLDGASVEWDVVALILNQILVDLIAIQTKVGTGASTPSGTTAVLQATGTGASAWATLSPAVNFLVNPGFEVWQRGAGAFTTDGVYTADRWLMDEVGTDALSVTREGTTKSTNSLYSLAAAFTLGNGAGATQIYQQLSINTNDENHQLLGQVVSARIAVRTATASAARVFIATDGTGGTTTYSGYHTGGSTFENLDVTNITVPSNATYVRVGVAFAASSTVYMDNATLMFGTPAGTYNGLTRAEEWARCQRYYQVLDAASSLIFSMNADASRSYACNYAYSSRVALAAPTATKNGTWAVTNVGQPVTGGVGQTHFRLSATATAGGFMQWLGDSADDNVTIEANP